MAFGILEGTAEFTAVAAAAARNFRVFSFRDAFSISGGDRAGSLRGEVRGEMTNAMPHYGLGRIEHPLCKGRSKVEEDAEATQVSRQGWLSQ